MERIIKREHTNQLMIPLENIIFNPLNTYGEDNYEDIKNSIVTYGLITPISVIGPDEQGKYMLIAGEQRVRIFTSLCQEGIDGFQEIPAYVIGDMNMNETEQQLLIESSNIDTRDSYDKTTHYFNIVKLIRELANQRNLEKGEYVKLRSEYMKCSPRYARFYEQIFDSENQELKEMVSTGEISVSRAGRIATMEPEKQEEVISDIKSGMNQDEAVQKQRKKKEKATAVEISEREMSVFDPFDDSSFEENWDSFDESKNEDTSLNIDDIDDIDFNAFNTSSLSHSIDTDNKPGSKKADIKAVLSWCNHMQSVEKPTDEEWEVLEACKAIITKFY